MGYRVGFVLVFAACSLNVNRSEVPPPDATPVDAAEVDAADAADAGPRTCVSSMSAGRDHACTVRTDGTVWCWGSNEFGQLGDDTSIDRPTPVQVQGLAGITAAEAGGAHSCTVGAGGMVWCWGRNDFGQLGNGTRDDSKKPVQIANQFGVVQMTLGDAHSCARLQNTGQVICWGKNDLGQLGDGSITSRSMPLVVAGPVGVTTLAAGANTTCAVDGDRQLWCWGNNNVGQLGDGSANPRSTAHKLTMPESADVARVAVGDSFTCAVTTSGGLSCWGSNQFRQLGANSGGSRQPMPIETSIKADAIAAGGRFACVIEDDDRHRVWCWGDNDNLQLAGLTSSLVAFPTLSSHEAAVEITAGNDHLCVRTGETLTCSGDNNRGQLGDGHRTTQARPSPVPGLMDVLSISSGAHHTCAVLRGGTVRCWGENESGQLGDGSTVARSIPVAVLNITGATQVVTGAAHTCALVGDGVMCWGRNERGQLGDTSMEQRSIARPVIGGTGALRLTGVTRLAAARSRTCALANGRVVCWGEFNARADDGSGGTVSSSRPQVVDLPPDIVGIATGAFHACAIKAGGVVACWGFNGLGELGADPMTVPARTVPIDIMGLGGVDQLDAHGAFTCAHVATDDTVRCWGSGAQGQLGNGNTINAIVPQTVMGLAGARKIATGFEHACAINPNGRVACWGAGFLGQVGDGRYDRISVAVDVPGLDNVVDIDGGDQHTCAVRSDGTVWCWGDGRRGELGDGVSVARVPVTPNIPCP
jgi:alpha-tubulin suppressor-like RCC1 family protein